MVLRGCRFAFGRNPKSRSSAFGEYNAAPTLLAFESGAGSPQSKTLERSRLLSKL